MTSRSVVVVTAGLSQPSSTRLLGEQLAAATVAALGEPAEVRVVEVRDLAHQLVDNAPVYGHGPSMEDYTAQTPLVVGSPQQAIERTLQSREYVGDYQRQLFLIDHAGLPLTTVLEQLDILGEEVVPVLRREFAALKPAHVPDAPTHA